MAKVNLGNVLYIPYKELYDAFETNVANVDSVGGWKTVNGVNYVFMCGTATGSATLALPNKTDSYSLYYTKNGVITPFSTRISLVSGDTFSINVRYT